jgi:hypothetical protein
MMRLLLGGLTLMSALTLLGGCAGEEMAPYQRLTSLRVLAIQSNPVAPGPGETTTLEPLLYVPAGQSEPELSWSWCPFPGSASEGYPCEFSSEDLAELGELGVPLSLPPLELGVGPRVDFVNTMPPELLMLLCARLNQAAPTLACRNGFPVQIQLRVKTDQDEVFAVRTLNLAFDPAQAQNVIPALPGLELRVGTDWTPVTEDFVGPVRRDEPNELRALITEDQAEFYQLATATGQAVSQRERLTLSWFVESGDTKSRRTGFIEGVSSLEVLNENEWSPDRKDDYPRDTAEVVLVLRDDREGVSWWRHTFDLVEAP